MSDRRLRQLEIKYASSRDIDDYCNYTTYLRSHGSLFPLDELSGAATGSLPAIIHLLAPSRVFDFPTAMCPRIVQYKKEDREYNRAAAKAINIRRIKAQECFPREGILSGLFRVFNTALENWGNRHTFCNCSDPDYGHGPECPVVAGTGHIAEDYWGYFNNLVDSGSNYHNPNILDAFLDEGVDGLYEMLEASDYTLSEGVEHLSSLDYYAELSASAGLVRSHASERHPAEKTFSLVMTDKTSVPGPLVGVRGDGYTYNTKFECHIYDDLRCFIRWSTIPRGDAENPLSSSLSDFVRYIPVALNAYRVWEPL